MEGKRLFANEKFLLLPQRVHRGLVVKSRNSMERGEEGSKHINSVNARREHRVRKSVCVCG